MKVCTKCLLPKEPKEFGACKGGKDGLRSICKQCCKERAAEQRQEHPEYTKEYSAKNSARINAYGCAWQRSNPEKIRNKNYKRKYGISLDDYNAMLKSQNDCCAICTRHKSLFKKPLAVDHDHNTGKVRGLLCHDCNTVLGFMHEDISCLLRAIAYLKQHGCSYENT